MCCLTKLVFVKTSINTCSNIKFIRTDFKVAKSLGVPNNSIPLSFSQEWSICETSHSNKKILCSERNRFPNHSTFFDHLLLIICRPQ